MMSHPADRGKDGGFFVQRKPRKFLESNVLTSNVSHAQEHSPFTVRCFNVSSSSSWVKLIPMPDKRDSTSPTETTSPRKGDKKMDQSSDCSLYLTNYKAYQ